MNHHRLVVLFLFLATISSSSFKLAESATNCIVEKVELPVTPIKRVILRFECFPGTDSNPSLPTAAGSSPTEFNEMDLSPNFYFSLPYTQLCLFTNVYSLNMSSNSLTSLTDAFKGISCMSALTTIDFSNNFISSPLVASDFDDSIAARLVTLNLNSNQIPSVDSNAFIKSDGTTRFPNLVSLNLANNLIKQFDLLWPMALPQPALRVNLRNNKIDTLTNPTSRSYSDALFVAMTSGRSVDVTNNPLTTLSDSNLLQYKVNSADGFKQFLNKLSNYDFRQTSNAFTCSCPSGGLYTVFWYQSISASISPKTAPIYALVCSNIANNYLFDFPCQFTNPQFSTSASNLLGSGGSSSAANSPYWLLLLLLIPLALLLFLLFVCCCGRCCLACCHRSCSLHCCPCFRPDDEKPAGQTGKVYDAAILYNYSDEKWVEKNFIPSIQNIRKGYKIYKLPLTNGRDQQLTKEQKHIMRASKRIILLFSGKFHDAESKNKYLKKLLKDIALNDPYCIITVVRIDEAIPRYRIEQYIDELEDDSLGSLEAGGNGNGNSSMDSSAWAVGRRKPSYRKRLSNNVKFNTGLRDIEYLEWSDKRFWRDLLYIMPQNKYAIGQTEIIEAGSRTGPATRMREGTADDFAQPVSTIISTQYTSTSNGLDNDNKSRKIIMNTSLMKGLNNNRVADHQTTPQPKSIVSTRQSSTDYEPVKRTAKKPIIVSAERSSGGADLDRDHLIVEARDEDTSGKRRFKQETKLEVSSFNNDNNNKSYHSEDENGGSKKLRRHRKRHRSSSAKNDPDKNFNVVEYYEADDGEKKRHRHRRRHRKRSKSVTTSPRKKSVDHQK